MTAKPQMSARAKPDERDQLHSNESVTHNPPLREWNPRPPSILNSSSSGEGGERRHVCAPVKPTPPHVPSACAEQLEQCRHACAPAPGPALPPRPHMHKMY